jgi:glycosyltransferase involved in cell wall biosynthesis
MEATSAPERQEDEDKMRVLYLAGVDASTSLALEVASHIDLDPEQFKVAVYYAGGDGRNDFVDRMVNLGGAGRFDLKAPMRLFRLVRRWRPHVIHVHHTVSAFWGTLIGRSLGVPVIIKTEHDDHRYYSVGQNAFNAVTQLLADRLICNSDRTYEHFHSWEKRIAKEKSTTVHNGVDVERINRPAGRAEDARAALGFQDDQVVIGSVGRLIRQKNYETFIRAMPNVIQEAPSTRFLLVGDGHLRQHLEHVARDVGVREYVTFTGGVGRDRVFELLHAIDVFAVPSSWEGFCNAAVEAMAAGRPIISSDIDTLHEVIGDVAVYADPHLPDALAGAMLTFAHMGERERRRHGASARKRAEERYSVQRTADAYRQIYWELLAEKRPTRKPVDK